MPAPLRAGTTEVVHHPKLAVELRYAQDGELGWSTKLRSAGSRPTPAPRHRGDLVSAVGHEGVPPGVITLVHGMFGAA